MYHVYIYIAKRMQIISYYGHGWQGHIVSYRALAAVEAASMIWVYLLMVRTDHVAASPVEWKHENLNSLSDPPTESHSVVSLNLDKVSLINSSYGYVLRIFIYIIIWLLLFHYFFSSLPFFPINIYMHVFYRWLNCCVLLNWLKG